MVQHKPVASLSSWAKRAVPRMVMRHIVRSAHGIHANWIQVISGELDRSPEEILSLQVERFKQYLEDNIIWTDRQEMFVLLLQGLEEAFVQVRKNWTMTTENTQYCKVMEALNMFTPIVILPRIRKLDFQDVPRSVRSRMLELVPTLTSLQTIIIGPGNSGGWKPLKGKAAENLSAGLSHLQQLQHFSMKKDCSIAILSALVGACRHTLEVLDVENSRPLDDKSVAVITQCSNITELNVTGTSISDEGKARLIMGLPRLKHLVRADYLCDALGWIDYLEEVEDPVFEIEEFLPSQSYYFHETWQVESAARMCPNIKKMLFIQHPTCCPSLKPLQAFTKLQDLQLHGSYWQQAEMEGLIEAIGPQLQHLGLISVKGLDFSSLRDIFTHCTSLAGVVFNNCGFDKNINQHATPCKLSSPHLVEMVITSGLTANYLTWLIKRARNLRVLHIGCSTDVEDSTFKELVEEGYLQELEELQVERSDLSLKTLNTLIEGCKRLKSVGDLGAWACISGQELGQMRQVVHEQNLQLDLSSHKVIRRFLDMEGEDRRTMMNLMTGPLLERIRIAQETVRNEQNQYLEQGIPAT